MLYNRIELVLEVLSLNYANILYISSIGTVSLDPLSKCLLEFVSKVVRLPSIVGLKTFSVLQEFKVLSVML